MTMVKPVFAEEELKRLDALEDSRLRPEFMESVYFLRSKIYKQTRAKQMNGVDLGARELLGLCGELCRCFNSDKVVYIQSSFEHLVRQQFETAKASTLAEFYTKVEGFK